MALEKYLLVPDCHVPYHNASAFKLMLKAARSARINNVVVLGDFVDFFAVSSYPKPPDRVSDLGVEVDAGRVALGELEAICRGRRIYIAGNHEDRLQRYLVERAPALFNTVRVDRLLGLTSRGWDYVPYKSAAKIGKLHLTHDLGKAGKYAHYDALNAVQGNVVIGHTHRLGWAVEGNVRGKPHVGVQLGWLGDFNQIDYMHRIRAARDWAHGFGIAYVEPSGNVHVTPIPIVGGAVLVEGKLIRC
jgi:predicted phosphodiesterase